MDSKPELKVSAIIADLTNFLKECTAFEAKHVVKEKYVSSQIIQVPTPTGSNGIQLPGQPKVITTVMISVVYIHEVKTEILK